MTEAVIPYEKFTTGYTYREISDMVWSHSSDSKDWPLSAAGRRRHSVLGLWREIKLELYDRYLQQIGMPHTEDDSMSSTSLAENFKGDDDEIDRTDQAGFCQNGD